MATPATAINDPSTILPALLSVDFVGTAAPLELVALLLTAEESDGAGVVTGMEDEETRAEVSPAEEVLEDAEIEPVNVAEAMETDEAVVEAATETEKVVEVAETDATVADAAVEGVQQERYEVVLEYISVPE